MDRIELLDVNCNSNELLGYMTIKRVSLGLGLVPSPNNCRALRRSRKGSSEGQRCLLGWNLVCSWAVLNCIFPYNNNRLVVMAQKGWSSPAFLSW